MRVLLIVLCALFMSFFLVTLGLAAWSIIEVKVKSREVVEKKLSLYERLEEEDPDAFNKLEKYKGVRLAVAVIIVALLLLLIFYLL